MDNYLQWLESEHEALRELAIEYAIKDNWQASEIWSVRASAVRCCLIQYRAFLETGEAE